MKIITWNVAHQAKTGNNNLHQMAETLEALSPDFIVLTEYVPGDVHQKFIMNLKSLGYEAIISKCPPTEKMQNHVLIAARMHMEPGDSSALTGIFDPIPCNMLHVTIPEISLGILGLRMPVGMNAAKKKAWWDWVTAVADRNRDHPFIFLGDFNTDESSKGLQGWNRILQLRKSGWYHAQPTEGASYWGASGGVRIPFSIDHAFFSQHFTVVKSEYLTDHRPHIFAKNPLIPVNSEKVGNALSDHAVLRVEFDLNNQPHASISK